MQNYRIKRHKAVDRDLANIMRLITEYSSKEVALAKLTEIEKTIRSLIDVPHKGSVRDDLFPGLRVIPAGKKGAVCFTVDDKKKTVRIIAIAYAGEEWLRKVEAREE